MNPVPFLWLAAAVVFLVVEASTVSMTSIWFAAGSAAALLTCLFTDSFRAQALVFIVAEDPVRLLLLHPAMKQHRKVPVFPE